MIIDADAGVTITVAAAYAGFSTASAEEEGVAAAVLMAEENLIRAAALTDADSKELRELKLKEGSQEPISTDSFLRQRS